MNFCNPARRIYAFSTEYSNFRTVKDRDCIQDMKSRKNFIKSSQGTDAFKKYTWSYEKILHMLYYMYNDLTANDVDTDPCQK